MAKNSNRYVKCEITGEFIPESESETVRINITKKKGINFKVVPVDFVSKEVAKEDTEEQTIVIPQVKINKTKPVDPNSWDDVVGKANPKVTEVRKKKNLVPGAFNGLFIGPDDPEFELKGAKEKRRV
jgi:hypothetical protein